MSELDRLAAELRRQLPDVPERLALRELLRLRSDPRARIRRRWLPTASPPRAIAALVVALLLAGAGASWWRPAASSSSGLSLESKPATRTLVAERQALELRLADGSAVRLAKGAQARLGEAADAAVRIDLSTGRGDFQVTERQRAFEVSAGPYVAEVLGTEFSVTYEPGRALAVAVTRGVVALRTGGRRLTRLSAGERFEADLTIADRWHVTRAAGAIAAAANATAESKPPDDRVRAVALPPRESHDSGVQKGGGARSDWREAYLRRDYRTAVARARARGWQQLLVELDSAELAELADAARLGGDLSAALEALQRLERRFPNAVTARQAPFLTGRVLLQLGRSAEATAAFERYLATHPDGTYSLETLGRLLQEYAKNGNRARAQQLAERYLARAPSGPYQRLARSLISR